MGKWKKERNNRIIEDMLKMYVMDQPSKWEDFIHLVEFSYTDGYHASLKMIPFETLYDRKCKTLIRWDNSTGIAVAGPELLKEIEEQLEKIN